MKMKDDPDQDGEWQESVTSHKSKKFSKFSRDFALEMETPTIFHSQDLEASQKDFLLHRAFQRVKMSPYFLQFVNKLPSTIFTSDKIVAEDGSPIRIELLDSATNAIVTSDPFASLKIGITVLRGDFDSKNRSGRDFEHNVVRERSMKGPLLTGKLDTMLRNGACELNVAFTDNSSFVGCRKFKLGAKVVQKSDSGEVCRVREAISEPFIVKDHPGELYKNLTNPKLLSVRGINSIPRPLDTSKSAFPTSFWIEGSDGEFERICRSLGLAGPELFQPCGANENALAKVLVEKKHIFDKVVAPSELDGELNHLVIPNKYADSYFPPLCHSSSQTGPILSFEDHNGKLWLFQYSYDHNNQSYLLTKEWSKFAKEKQLCAGDTVSFYRDANDRFYIDWRQQSSPIAIEEGFSLDRGTWTSSVPESGSSGVLQSLQPQIVSCSPLQEAKKKVSDGMLQVTETIQQEEAAHHLATLELKPYQCNSMDTEELYISKSPPLHFCAYNFVSLFFPYCKLPQLWKGGEQLLVSLKHLDARHSNLLWIPNLSKAQKLERLNLEGCGDLVGISSIEYLIKLQHLNLKGCQSLKGLPSLIRLKLLKTLDLSHCLNLTRLPPSLGCLPTLCELNLKKCEKLENLPRSVMHLMKSVETLNISGCSKLLKSISGYENAAVCLSAQPPFELLVVPSSGATEEGDLPNNSSNSPISKSTEDSCLQSQPITTVQQDSVGDSSLQDLSSDLQDVRGNHLVESEDDDSMAIPLIISLLSKLRVALSFPPDTVSSHASSSSSEDNNTLSINHTENNSSELVGSKIVAALLMEDQQQLCKDVDHEDAKSEEKPLLAHAESIHCEVEDWEFDLSREDDYHKQHKLYEVHSKASEALVGNTHQRFCQQCCRFHDLTDFDDEESTCRSRLASYHQKHRRQSSATNRSEEEHSDNVLDNEGDGTDSQDQILPRKRTRKNVDIAADTEQQAITTVEHLVQALDDYLGTSLEHFEEPKSFRNIENALLTMAEQVKSSKNHDEKAATKSVMAWLAEVEPNVPKIVRNMKSAKDYATVIAREMKVGNASLFIGELELRLLDMELSRIKEEEDEIEAELQQLMDKKREILQH